ncbi:hypothetical protein FCG67_18595 [Rhodococcus oryzae]|uniref:DUF6924 domain-containing protein n=1 Tax=Rhodococcus oryzae TaxID=2571143 RepID=A0ABY2RGR1_9NOCA|nr:hypothetical protein [Rhodococcus oryzae]TJZ76028.1 hypothetical protein FCG67_18595 [Rhodococcus oryzae]
MSMTWPQIRGLNYSTMGRAVRADMWCDDSFMGRAWFLPPTTWRIEDAAGEATYIENGTDEYRRADDGVMVHTAKSPNRFVMTSGAAPWQLLQAYAMWPLEDSGTDQRLVPTSLPRLVEVRGRAGWQVQFADAMPSGEVTYVIDAELGIALSRSEGSQVMELAAPHFDEDFDPALFTWIGPVREEEDRFVTPAQREYEAKALALAQMPRPQVAWLPRTIEVQPVDGDPRTGALDLQVTAQYGYLTLRQWVTEVGEPEITWMQGQTPLRHREAVGPWTFEIRSHNLIDSDDCARIIGSIAPADPPAATAAQIREMLDRDIAERADAELSEMLGTGRHLDDYLGDRGGDSLFIRTDFSNGAAWREVVAAAMAAGEGDESEFMACLTCIDNPANDGLSISELLKRIGDQPPYYVFIADTTTITDPEHPILAVDTGPADSGHGRGQTVRVIPSQMWSIENNLSLANMDFEDFADAAGPDGVYRGFS